mgnify:FL=1|jgi:hypothetical protein
MPDLILHVYGQDFPRDMPTVVGTSQALRALGAAINQALRQGEALSAEVQDTAGESYVVRVCCRRPHRSEPPPARAREKLGKADIDPLPSSFWERLGER